MKTLPLIMVVGITAAGPASGHANHAGHDGHHSHDSSAQPGARADQPNGSRDGQPKPRQMDAVTLPAPTVKITIEGELRVIRANGIPAHAVGTFPNTGNPNAIRPQNHEYRIPAKPVAGTERIPARPEFGIALNGVIFDAGTGEFWSPTGRQFGGGSDWNYEALGGGVEFGIDMNNAHVQPTGKYHYHGIPTGLLEALGGETGIERMVHIGWAFDGFPIYGPYGHADAKDTTTEVRLLKSSYRLKTGARPTAPDGPGGVYDGKFTNDYEYVAGLGDLDESNGRFGPTPEFPEGTYYYVMTKEFPSVPRSYRGTPDESMRRRGGPRGPGGPRGRGGPGAGPDGRPNRPERPRGRGPRPERGDQGGQRGGPPQS